MLSLAVLNTGARKFSSGDGCDLRALSKLSRVLVLSGAPQVSPEKIIRRTSNSSRIIVHDQGGDMCSGNHLSQKWWAKLQMLSPNNLRGNMEVCVLCSWTGASLAP
ncbi:unnamed protein product [Calypogeia fissa]